MRKQKILVVEDDPEVRDFVIKYLNVNGYDTFLAENGDEMFAVMNKDSIDLIIMDLMLPGDDGLELTKKIRNNSDIPIIMVTGRSDVVDRIVGLEVGADDYLPKPFEPRELLARIKTVMRRVKINDENKNLEYLDKNKELLKEKEYEEVKFDRWTLVLSQRIMIDDKGKKLSLSTAEYDLIKGLCERPKKILSRDQLLDMVYGREMSPFDRSIDVLVMRVRSKIEKDRGNPVLIKAVRGAGYIFTPDINWS